MEFVWSYRNTEKILQSIQELIDHILRFILFLWFEKILQTIQELVLNP
jgi:hypothetical protein